MLFRSLIVRISQAGTLKDNVKIDDERGRGRSGQRREVQERDRQRQREKKGLELDEVRGARGNNAG